MTTDYLNWSSDDNRLYGLELWRQQIVSLGALTTTDCIAWNSDDNRLYRLELWRQHIVSLGALTTTHCIAWSSDDNRLCRLEQWWRQHRQTWSKRSIVPSANWRLGRWRHAATMDYNSISDLMKRAECNTLCNGRDSVWFAGAVTLLLHFTDSRFVSLDQ